VRATRPALALPAALAAVLCAAPPASARSYDIPRALSLVLGRVAAGTDVPIRLPARLALDYDRGTSADGFGARDSYALALGATAGCRASSACSLASFSGRRGGRLPKGGRVALARGIAGAYTASHCGASCSPPAIRWVQGGVLYAISAKVPAGPRATLVRAANSAIRRAAD
jgi:hypothetical protein